MTAIVAIAHDDKVTMGADSCGSLGRDIRKRSVEDSKIACYDEQGLLIGISGSSRWLSVVKDRFAPPALPSDLSTLIAKRGYIADVVDGLHELAKAYDLIDDEKEVNGFMLLGFAGTLWIVDCGFGITMPDTDYMAVGCGDQVALGALAILMNTEGLNAAGRVNRALEVAAQFDGAVAAPFVFAEA
jgi:ATP-dependent protease HslVU (ClpYQ) peptidase subunit